jgi:hypothetical protein
LGFVLAAWLSAKACLGSDSPATDQSGSSCGQFGTSVNFVATPSEAGRRAEKEEKLVLVLHLSGYFEDPKFT